MSINIHDFPKKPGIYLIKDCNGAILYIGKAKNLRDRIQQYFSSHKESRIMVPFLMQHMATIEVIVTLNEKEALLLESSFIKKYHPKYNSLLKDDKSFIYIVIHKNNQWPMIQLMRSRFICASQNNAIYFGPYLSYTKAQQIVDVVTKCFLLRQCSEKEFLSRNHPCLFFFIKRCLAPCAGKCTHLQYQEKVNNAIAFLQGRKQSVIDSLIKQMEEASQALQFERAQQLFYVIREIKNHHVPTIYSSQKELDVIQKMIRKFDVFLIILSFRKGQLSDIHRFHSPVYLEKEEEYLPSFLLRYYSEKKKICLKLFYCLIKYPIKFF